LDKRNIFGELMDGVEAMKTHRKGKLALRSYKIGLASRSAAKKQTQGPSTPVSRAGENAREPSSAQDDKVSKV
jgi:hypothetical protein